MLGVYINQVQPQQNTSRGFTINWLTHYPEMMLGISCSTIHMFSQHTVSNPTSTNWSPYGIQAGLDISALEQSVVQQGLAPSSKHVYKSAKDRFISFCEKFHFNPLPVTETLLCQYVSYLATQHIVHSSIKVCLSAIHHLHIENHMPDPHTSNMARLEQVVKGVKRDQARKLPNQWPSPPHHCWFVGKWSLY